MSRHGRWFIIPYLPRREPEPRVMSDSHQDDPPARRPEQ